MKRHTYLAAVVAVLGLAGTGWAQAAAPVESFVGTVKAVSGSSLTVERGSIVGTFAIESSTHVSAKGSTAKTKANKEAGKPGLTVPDVVHVGDQVVVKFHESGKGMIANEVQVRATLAAK